MLPHSVILHDTTATLHRAFHSWQASTKGPHVPLDMRSHVEKVLWSVVRRFSNMNPIQQARHPDSINRFIFCFDNGKNVRVEMSPLYKTHRPQKPPELKQALDWGTEWAKGLESNDPKRFLALPGRHYELLDCEADDLIATAVDHFVKFQPDGPATIVVSPDYDMCTLINSAKRVYMFDPRTRKFLDEDGVKKIFGVEPCRTIDIKCLLGDRNDGVEGVKGIGKKIGAMLINKYGSIDAVLSSSLDGEKKIVRENIVNAREAIRGFQRILTPILYPQIVPLLDKFVGFDSK